MALLLLIGPLIAPGLTSLLSAITDTRLDACRPCCPGCPPWQPAGASTRPAALQSQHLL